MSVWKRLLGAAIGGGGTYAALRVFDPWALGHPVMLGAAGAMALAGFALGPKVWEAVAHL